MLMITNVMGIYHGCFTINPRFAVESKPLLASQVSSNRSKWDSTKFPEVLHLASCDRRSKLSKGFHQTDWFSPSHDTETHKTIPTKRKLSKNPAEKSSRCHGGVTVTILTSLIRPQSSSLSLSFTPFNDRNTFDNGDRNLDGNRTPCEKRSRHPPNFRWILSNGTIDRNIYTRCI